MLMRKAKTALARMPILLSVLRRVFGPLQQRRGFRRLRRYCSLLPDRVQQPTFVIIGANDGITEDPVSDIFLADSRWKGLLIEPVPFCFQRLAATFQDSQRFALEQAAIGKPSGSSSFYYVDQDATDDMNNRPFWFDQVGSFDRTHILRHLGGALEQHIVECTVEVRALGDILQKHNIDRLHFLQIDTEGYDYEIIQTLDLANDAPWAILVEHKHLSGVEKTAMLDLLRTNGYRVAPCGAFDYFAIHNRAQLQELARDDALPY